MGAELRDVLAYEIFEAVQAGDFNKWWREHAPVVEDRFPWKEREILPTREGRSLGIIEIMGHSEAGKSSGLNYLRDCPIKGYRTIIRPELIVDSPDGSRTDYGLGELKTFMRIVYGNARRMTFWNHIKFMSFGQGLEQIADLMKEDSRNQRKGNPIKMVVERGPNDIVSTSILAASEKLGKGSVSRSQDLENIFDDLFLSTFFLGLAGAQWVDAVALYGVSKRKDN